LEYTPTLSNTQSIAASSIAVTACGALNTRIEPLIIHFIHRVNESEPFAYHLHFIILQVNFIVVFLLIWTLVTSWREIYHQKMQKAGTDDIKTVNQEGFNKFKALTQKNTTRHSKGRI
jgi:hypothetical protein